jgi:hypothetical protein
MLGSCRSASVESVSFVVAGSQTLWAQRIVKQKIADKIGPGNAILRLAQGDHHALSITILELLCDASQDRR